MALDKKLADYLWTARWAANAEKKETAIEAITNALVHIGAEKGETLPEPDRTTPPMPEDYGKGFTDPEFVVVRGVRFVDRGSYKTPSGMFSGIVAHYTVSGRTAQNARNVLSYLASQNLGCMVMDEDGKIYIPENFDPLRSWGYHAGTSKWGNATGVSNIFAGMEICCWGRNSKVGPYRESKGEANIISGKYQQFTPKQEEAFANFCLWAHFKNKEYKIENTCGHDELRTNAGKHGDKQDPGASLSMTMPAFRKYLHERLKLLK